MADGTFPVQWTGQQAVITLPGHIDTSNADQIREQLLWIINRGPDVLIADLTGTVSCDYSGADALARAYRRAVASGTQLRLVVTANVVRRLLSLNGLDRLVPVYPDLGGAIAAKAGAHEPHEEQGTRTEDRVARAEKLLGLTIDGIFDVGLILQGAIDLPPDVTAQRITDALRRLDDLVREVRNHVFAERAQGTEPDLPQTPPPRLTERAALAMNQSASLQGHLEQTARAVQAAAIETIALLERRADLIGQPGRIDYPTEIKRWRTLADLAQRAAERWEQQQ